MDINVIFMIVWAAVFIITIGIELATAELVSIWFSVGAIVAFCFCFGNIPFWVSIIVFFVVSTLILTLFKLFFQKKIDSRTVKTNYESLVGKSVTVFKVMEDPKIGLCKIGDVIWTVQADQNLTLGQAVTVSSVEGNRLIVSKKED